MEGQPTGGAADGQLSLTRKSQATWSLTANRLKSRYERVRKVCFAFSVLAALLAALASQLPDFADKTAGGSMRLTFSVVSAALLASVTFLTLRFLGGQNASKWVQARAISEALKRAAYTFAAGAAPYDNKATRDDVLESERNAVESQGNGLLLQMVDRSEADESLRRKKKDSDLPETDLRPDEYTSRRLKYAKDWYETRADEHARAAKRMRTIEFSLALLATVATGIVGAIDKQTIIAQQPFDLIALTGVLTTLSGAILAYIEASRLDYIITSYRAAARQLGELLAKASKAQAGPAATWSSFVEKVESIIATENSAWIAKVSRQDPQ